MFSSHTLLRLITCTLLLLISTSGESQPHMAHKGTPDMDRMDEQRVLLFDAVKKGILSSLGMDGEPRPAQKASHRERMKMHQLYKEKLSEMRRNSSQPVRENWESTMSTVLFPVKPLEVLRRGSHQKSGQRMQWYRAVFQKNPNIQTEMILARAELKISWHMSYSFKIKVRQDIKVKINGRKPMISVPWTFTKTNISGTQDVIMDISFEVKGWIRTDGQSLVVDVGVVQGKEDVLKLNAIITLELGLMQFYPAEKTRLRRSSKEDNCDERGWCCRKSVAVSFKDIGWTDWVVAPAEYTMHFCDGTCPHNYKPASMHTQVKSRLHLITKGGTPRPCCVPAAYEPMVLMHYDSRGKLRLTTFSDFIVSKCHCA
ncbi:uncharacterized protein gdf15 [Leuresthes tenuis]|uniref:uncharacterized protein gdf15 n=1 Tax=Leuresthes tenuis TaxID=355514 RepID=UPI003B50BB59